MLLTLAGGAAAAVTVLFAGLALFRAPYTLAIGMVAQLTARFTTLVVERQTRRPAPDPVAPRGRDRRAVARGRAGGRPGSVGRSCRWCSATTCGCRLASARCSPSARRSRSPAWSRRCVLIALGRTGGQVRAWLLAAVPGAAVLRVLAGAGARPHLLGVPRGRGRGVRLDGGRDDQGHRPARGGLTRAQPTAARVARPKLSTIRSICPSVRPLKNGIRISRSLTSVVTGQSVSRAANRRPPIELCSGT